MPVRHPKAVATLAAGLLLVLALPTSSHARVTRIVIDASAPLPAAANVPAGAGEPGIAYEQLTGRAFGELDPALPGNALIQDIALARGAPTARSATLRRLSSTSR